MPSGPRGACGVRVVSGFHTNFHTYADHYRLPLLKSIAARFLRWLHNRTARTLAPSREHGGAASRARHRATSACSAAAWTRGSSIPRRRDSALRARVGRGWTPRRWRCSSDASRRRRTSRSPCGPFQRMTERESRRALRVRRRRAEGRAGCARRIRSSSHAGARTGEDLARHYASRRRVRFPQPHRDLRERAAPRPSPPDW